MEVAIFPRSLPPTFLTVSVKTGTAESPAPELKAAAAEPCACAIGATVTAVGVGTGELATTGANDRAGGDAGRATGGRREA